MPYYGWLQRRAVQNLKTLANGRGQATLATRGAGGVCASHAFSNHGVGTGKSVSRETVFVVARPVQLKTSTRGLSTTTSTLAKVSSCYHLWFSRNGIVATLFIVVCCPVFADNPPRIWKSTHFEFRPSRVTGWRFQVVKSHGFRDKSNIVVCLLFVYWARRPLGSIWSQSQIPHFRPRWIVWWMFWAAKQQRFQEIAILQCCSCNIILLHESLPGKCCSTKSCHRFPPIGEGLRLPTQTVSEKKHIRAPPTCHYKGGLPHGRLKRPQWHLVADFISFRLSSPITAMCFSYLPEKNLNNEWD